MSKLITNGLRHLGASVDNLTLDNAGRVLMPQQPAFHATGGLLQTGTDLVVQFPNALVNVGSHYNTTNYRFTAPVAGVYAFEFSGMSNNLHNRFGLFRNGSLYGGQKFSAAQVYENFGALWVISLAVNDYVDVRIGINGSTNNGDLHEEYRGFSGWLIG